MTHSLLEFAPSLPAWLAQTIVVLGAGLLATALGLLVHHVLYRLLAGIARASESPSDDMLMARLARPTRYAMVALFLVLFAREIPALGNFWTKIAGFVMPALVGWVVISVLHALVHAMELRNDIRGETDSEHIFYFLLTLHLRHPERPLIETVGRGLRRIIQWSEATDPPEPAGLNIVLTDGDRLVGSRYNRTLWHLVRDEVTVCGICGKKHVRHEPGRDYHAVEIASEPISGENWQPFANGVVYSVDADCRFEIEPIPETALLQPA